MYKNDLLRNLRLIFYVVANSPSHQFCPGRKMDTCNQSILGIGQKTEHAIIIESIHVRYGLGLPKESRMFNTNHNG